MRRGLALVVPVALALLWLVSSGGRSDPPTAALAAPGTTATLATAAPQPTEPVETTDPSTATSLVSAFAPDDAATEWASAGSATPRAPEPVKLLFTGDVIVHTAVADSARAHGEGEYDFDPMFERIAPVVRAADLAICHLETPLDPLSRTPTGWPRFSAPAEIAEALVNAGFDGCSTASNHVLDRGVAGIADTLDVMDAVGLAHTGSAREPVERLGRLYNVGDLVVGHASYSYAVSGWLRSDQQWAANGLDEQQILVDARDLRLRGADFVVVSLHWGIEHQYSPTRTQETIGSALLDSNAVDLIVGHHAHVLQPVVQENGKFLLYGLGNTLSNQEPSCCGEVAQEGALMLIEVSPTPDGWVSTDLNYLPTWVDRHRGHVIIPTLDPDVSTHRHAAWLERSAIRVGRSLELEGLGLSAFEACEWMGGECGAPMLSAGS